MATLYLIPTPLSKDLPADLWLIASQRAQLSHLTHFVIEAAKAARQHLKQLGLSTPLQELTLTILNEHTPEDSVYAMLAPLNAGVDMGLLSEAGCPAVADPGANLVRLAHDHGHRVAPLVGPSSLLLALMASGTNGQRFAFHGYLPIERDERAAALHILEQRSREEACAQLFIETPYRNPTLLHALLNTLSSNTRLTAACDLTLPSETIISRRVVDWQTINIDLKRRPTLFIIYADPSPKSAAKRVS